MAQNKFLDASEQKIAHIASSEIENENKSIRQAILKKRRALSQDEVQSATQAILQKLLEYPLLQSTKQKNVIASYSSLRGEIDTTLINQRLRARGFHVALPKVLSQNQGLMDFFDCTEDSLISGAYGIMEPDLNTATKVAPHELTLMLVPLVVFDNKGHRIGMGGGFYDRYLKRLKRQCLLIGLAYDFQQVSHINAMAHDMPLDEIFTPSQHIVVRNKA